MLPHLVAHIPLHARNHASETAARRKVAHGAAVVDPG
jgi:hypothetical protein